MKNKLLGYLKSENGKRTRKYLKIAAVLFLVTIFIAYGSYRDTKDINEFVLTYTDYSTVGLLEHFLNYLYSYGLQTVIGMLILAILPIPYAFLLNLILFTFTQAFLWGYSFRYDTSYGYQFLACSIVPIMLQILAYAILTSALYPLHQLIKSHWKNLFKKEKVEIAKGQMKLIVKDIAKTSIKLYIPLVIIAGITEVFFLNYLFSVLVK